MVYVYTRVSLVRASQNGDLTELYEMELAEHTIYDLMRTFATATRALAMYDCRACLEELEKLPPAHQRSAWVMAMVGKAHYELGEYAAVSSYWLLLPMCQ